MRGSAVFLVLFMLVCGCESPIGPAEGSLGPFVCGSTTCDVATEYCYSKSIGPDAGGPPGGHCTPLPAACAATRTCGCLHDAATLCITNCIDDGGVTASCNQP